MGSDQVTGSLVRRAVSATLLLAAALAVPADAQSQVEVTAGIAVADESAPDGARVAPMVSLALGTDAVGFPLILEAGFARADFTSFGEVFHRNQGLFVLGTEGSLEVRKYCDPAGRPGGDHLFVVDARDTRRIECEEVELPFARQFLSDVRERSQTAMSQEHCFTVCELALQAQSRADRRGHLA